MIFNCSERTNNHTETWQGCIKRLTDHGSHCEIFIESRSSILLLVGKSSRGGFACMPDFGAGCDLVDLNDKFWNTERLVSVLGKADGITAATALYHLRNSNLHSIKALTCT